MATWYAVVQYYPDRIRGEFRNIGIVAWGETFAHRLIPDLPAALAEAAAGTIEMVREWSDSDGPDVAIARSHHPYSSIALSDRRGSIVETPEQLIAEVWRWFCGPLEGEQLGVWVWEEQAHAAAAGEGVG